MIEHIPHIRRCYQLADEAVASGNHPFGALLVPEPDRRRVDDVAERSVKENGVWP